MTEFNSQTHMSSNGKLTASSSVELNNNFEGSGLKILEDSRHRRNGSRGSISSTSSSDISEDGDIISVQDVGAALNTAKDDPKEEPDVRRIRSKSDGFQGQRQSMEPFEVFPSLPDSVLEQMGLLGDVPRERLSEEELEQKFTSLALSYTIDAATIKDRCERQRRYRDQTEKNLHVEIERLVDKITRLQPLCVDAEKTELLTGLLSQVETILNASYHAATCAERYGAVQQEERLSESVHLMINHVTFLKQQRDSARRQLQYTKRVLQESNSSENSPKAKPPINGKVMTKRRASIATIQPPIETIKSQLESRKIIRRTSEMTFKATSVSRPTRHSRLELGVDLVKIKEGIVENGPVCNTEEESQIQNDGDSSLSENEASPNISECSNLDEDLSCLSIVQKLYRQSTVRSLMAIYHHWTENGILHEFFIISAIVCFSLSIITYGNILIEIEYTKRGITPKQSFWHFGTLWSDILLPFSKKDYNDGSITS